MASLVSITKKSIISVQVKYPTRFEIESTISQPIQLTLEYPDDPSAQPTGNSLSLSMPKDNNDVCVNLVKVPCHLQ